MNDPTSKLEQFLKIILETLDQTYVTTQTTEFYKSSILPQLISQSRIIINGSPFGSRSQFQELWATLPQTQHQLLSFDAQLLPIGQGSNNQYVILARLKVRFDEAGKNRLGDCADLVPLDKVNRPLYGPWFGACLNLIVDEMINNSYNCECISSLDYRITEKPDASLFNI
ncbi:hypothetical protein CANARDRAFT_177800 [[Candida] arabinofermentans NRRL YB-2248]|uniref:SnoaL-like domain-containing protein n=1 Tax=[Candida] arabinofermentans NRRL YB-2248 TaxID=983967 RepID=A0A1E4SUZ0_9ASCO|nr:hypothetical protein CANARDRAFT_177800 [[Candida] arabinofermentans NRRL YB-2248]